MFMANVLVAVAQFAPGEDDNLPVITQLCADAATRGARVVVLPEYSAWFRPQLDAGLREHAQSVPGPFTEALQRIAVTHELTIVAGLIERVSDRTYNTVVAVDSSGVISSYRKQHLYDAFGSSESTWLAHGELAEPQIFTVDGVRFGLITCYDLRFPEAARVVTDAGADVIVVPSEWVRGPLKEHHWKTLLRARAIENTVFVAAADHTPPIGVGLSAVIDPSGVELAQLGTQQGVAVAQISTTELARVREMNPALQLRRYAVVPRG